MRSLLTLLSCLTLTLAVGCGGSSADDSQSSSGSTGAEDPSSACEGHTRDDACMGDDAFAACQAAAEQCPGAVIVAESCPLQFSCPGAAGDEGDDAAASTCNGHTADEQCMGAEAFAQCQQMEAQCPGAVEEMESCPLQFGCP